MSTNIRNTIFFELKIIKEYWQIVSIVGTIIFFCVYFWLENKEANERLVELTTTNKELKDRISRLEGQIDVINSNMVLFVEKNPGLTSFRLEMLEEAMDVQHLLNSINKKNDLDVKIIQVPTPIYTSQPILTQSTRKYDTVTIFAENKKKSIFKKKK